MGIKLNLESQHHSAPQYVIALCKLFYSKQDLLEEFTNNCGTSCVHNSGIRTHKHHPLSYKLKSIVWRTYFIISTVIKHYKEQCPC